jgi:hypothetical protein
MWRFTSTLHTFSWRDVLLMKRRDHCTITLICILFRRQFKFRHWSINSSQKNWCWPRAIFPTKKVRRACPLLHRTLWCVQPASDLWRNVSQTQTAGTDQEPPPTRSLCPPACYPQYRVAYAIEQFNRKFWKELIRYDTYLIENNASNHSSLLRKCLYRLGT